MVNKNLRTFREEAKEHKTDSRILYPRTDLDALNRGWINVYEFPQLVGSIEEVLRLDIPGAFVEIGCKQAGSTRTIVQVLYAQGAQRHVVSIDPDPKAASFHSRVDSLGQKRDLLIGRSQDETIYRQVPEELAWVLIDGCHCFECAKADIELYCPRIAQGGMVLLHDCDARVQERPKPSQPCGGGRKTVGVYDAMMGSKVLRNAFYMLHFVEGATDPGGNYWNGLAAWRRR